MLIASLRPVLLVMLGAALGASVADGTEPVTVTRLEGKSLSGELRTWTTARIAIRDDEREESFAPVELLSLRWGKAPDGDETRGAEVELVDGTLLPMGAFEVNGREASVMVTRAGEANEKIGVPLKSIRTVRMVALDEDLAAQWEEIVEQDVASDVLVVLKREGKSLDYVEGIVGDVTADNVRFTLDGDEIEVNRSRVAGILYFRDQGGAENMAVCVLHGRSGIRAHAKTVELEGDQLNIATPAGATISWVLSDIYFADFSDGKLVFLSDLEIATKVWKPLVEWPSSLKIAASYGDVRLDRSPFGGPLTIRYLARQSENVAAREEAFEKGLSIRSRTELAYRLPGGFRRFVAVAGIEPSTSVSGDVFLTIEGDGRPLLETAIAGEEGPREIDLDISGVKRLTIIVDYGKNLDTGDWLNLCNARLMK